VTGGPTAGGIVRATAWHAAGRVAAGLLGLVHAAWAFGALGAERYGLLAAAGVAALALALVEFGLRSSTVAFTAGDAARGDAAAARGTLAAATCVHLLAGSAVALPLLLAAEELVALCGAGPELRAEAAALLRIQVVALVLGNAASGWTSVLVALQRTGPLAAAMAAGGAAQLAGTVAGVRLLGWGAEALGLGFAAGTAVRVAVEAAAAGRALPGVSILPWRASRPGFARLRSVAGPLQAVRLADVFVFQWDQLLVLRFLGEGPAGIYRLASDLVLKVREAPLLLAAGVLPVAAGAAAAGDGEALRALHARATRYVAAAAAFLALFLAAAAPVVMGAAGGGAAGGGAAVFLILVLGIGANVVVGPGTQVGMAAGHAGIQAAAGLATASASAVLVPAALLAGGGLAGAAAGTSAALLLGTCLYLPRIHRALGFPPGRGPDLGLGRCLLFAAGLANAVFLLHRYALGGFLSGADRGRLAALLAVEGVLFGGLFALALARSGWADARDREFLVRALRGGAGGAP
jgi:O-antigen/teichoic acid export membrane protein